MNATVARILDIVAKAPGIPPLRRRPQPEPEPISEVTHVRLIAAAIAKTTFEPPRRQ